MMADPKLRPREQFRRFASQWLELDELPTMEKDAAIYPSWTPTLRDGPLPGGREIPMEAVTSGYLWLFELAPRS